MMYDMNVQVYIHYTLEVLQAMIDLCRCFVALSNTVCIPY